jgi:hypothetical protein
MLGAIIMLVIGFRAKRFKWWHALLLLVLAGLAVQLLQARLRVAGFMISPEWIWTAMFRQTLIDAAAYLGGIWLGIAWAAKKAIGGRSDPEEEQSPPEA